ncbi:MAG: DsbA family protein [Beijerinckiaceae bacterium]
MMRRRAFLQGGFAAGAALSSPTVLADHVGSTQHFDVPESAVRAAAALPSAFRIGQRNGDVTMIEFFDYNCPWCKQAARDLDPLLKSEPRLRVLLVNYAVLGVSSVLAGKVAVAVASDYAEKYRDFHREMFALRGTVGADEALDVARKLGIDADDLIELANSDVTTAALRASATFGADLGLTATPSYLIARRAYVGALTLPQKRAAIAAARSI